MAPKVTRIIAIASLIVLVTFVSPIQAKEFQSSWEIVESGTSENLLTAVEFGDQVWAFGTEGVMLNSNDSGLTWEIAESPTVVDIHHSESRFGALLVAGNSGLVLLKQDQDSDWLDISLPEGSHVNGVSLTGSQSVVVVGDGGTISRYENGGWESVSLSIGSDLMAVSFYDDELGVIVGANGTILFSADGGATWDYREPPEEMGEAEQLSSTALSGYTRLPMTVGFSCR